MEGREWSLRCSNGHVLIIAESFQRGDNLYMPLSNPRMFYCLKCGDPIAREVKKLEVDKFIWDRITSQQGHQKEDRCECKKCGFNFFEAIHKSSNWRPISDKSN